MGYIGAEPATSFEAVQKDRFTSTTGTTVTLSHTVSTVQDIVVWVNSVKQDYTNYSVNGTTLTLGGSLVSADIVEVVYVGRTLQTVAPATNMVTNAMMTDDAIDSAEIADGSVDTAHIADLNVTTGKIAADAITGAKIADDAINSEHYTDGSIDTAHIADDQVTYAKIQNVSATDKILGRDSSGAGVIEEISPANLRTMINVADGANAYTHPNHSGEVTSTADGATVIADNIVDEANLKISNSPTNGYALTAQSGNTGGLTWAEMSGGLWVKLGDESFSGNTSTVTFDNVFSSTYRVYKVHIKSATSNSDEQVKINFRSGASGSNATITDSQYNYKRYYNGQDLDNGNNQDDASNGRLASYFQLASNGHMGSNHKPFTIDITIQDPGDHASNNSGRTQLLYNADFYNNSNFSYNESGSCFYNHGTDPTGIIFAMTAGSFGYGNFLLYGLKP